MENTTVNPKILLLSNMRSSWLQEMLFLCTVVPMGLIGTVLNLMSLSIFLKKSIRKIALFKYLIILSLVNSIIAFTQIFLFYFMPNLFYDLALSFNGRLFITIGINDFIFYFFFLGNLIEIMINIERAIYFSVGFQNFKKISPYLICCFILILSLIIYIPNFLSIKMVPEDQIYILYRVTIPTDFALSKLGKIALLISYILEGPAIFILLIITNIIALISFIRFNQRKELIDRTNNIEMMSEGEIEKKNKIEKMDRKLLIITSFLSLASIFAELIKFTAQFFYFIITSLSPNTVGWLIFASVFSIALKQFTSIIIYYNYKIFRIEFQSLIKKIIDMYNIENY
jgi:hypothetical protein